MKRSLRLPAPPPAAPDPVLLEAVQAALAALAAAGEEAAPSAVERWIKANRHDVWAALVTAGALTGAIDVVKRVPGDSPRRVEASRKRANRQEPADAANRPGAPAERRPEKAPRRRRVAATAPPPKTVVAPPPTAPAGYDPTRSDLLRVLAIAREQGGVPRLRKLVEAVKLLADHAGGLDRLAVCLDALEELGVK